jgi:hypothetical protein
MIPSDGWKIEDPFREYKDRIKELEKRLAYAEKAKEWVLKNLREVNEKAWRGYWYDEPGSKDVFNREYLCELPDGWLLDDAVVPIKEVTKEELERLYPKKEE